MDRIELLIKRDRAKSLYNILKKTKYTKATQKAYEEWQYYENLLKEPEQLQFNFEEVE